MRSTITEATTTTVCQRTVADHGGNIRELETAKYVEGLGGVKGPAQNELSPDRPREHRHHVDLANVAAEDTLFKDFLAAQHELRECVDAD